MTVQELKDILDEYPALAEICISVQSLDNARIEIKKKDGTWDWIVGTDGYLNDGPHD